MICSLVSFCSFDINVPHSHIQKMQCYSGFTECHKNSNHKMKKLLNVVIAIAELIYPILRALQNWRYESFKRREFYCFSLRKRQKRFADLLNVCDFAKDALLCPAHCFCDVINLQ